MIKWLKWLGLPAGIAVLIALALHGGIDDVLHAIRSAGFALLWLVPLHALPLLLDAQAWRLLLGRSASLAYLWWIATVREAVSRLLPVASIGGEFVGVRLARWKIDDTSMVCASVIVEVLVTLAVQYVFAALGLVLIVAQTGHDGLLATVGAALLLSLPLPVVVFLLLRRGGLFHAIERWSARLPMSAHWNVERIGGAQLDAAIDALLREPRLLLRAFVWQFAGYLLGASEVYVALWMLGHPVSIGGAIAVEALTQAARHAAFFVPSGLGVQEAVVVLLARMFGVDEQTALSLALVKRMREVLFGCVALASWQAAELMRNRGGGVARNLR
ncbi:lysylphosphatidylglycerol synthase domain-containing protein [Paraburkholderia terrae]|uniref:lysylphosphatidylglycerol synthase domain-containing protein n=1 Tax=Paraburkholderia terrae TaxID=311230 RepID=UPI00296AEB81|nr:lysylphosphatidylglycerol synthase domain-containing protein [Paraburkholderia terrae]MDW3655841.1 lysylphosphatidylglycerol synthase domain-containing protein [Paraburkholderia terrae]